MLLVLGLSAAQAQDDELLPESSEEIQLEVLVFAFPGKGEGAELQPGVSADIGTGTPLASSSDGQSESNGHYVELASNERKFTSAYARLAASDQTRPLLFTAWRQALSDQRWVSIKSRDSNEVFGRVLLKPGKPLSVRVELSYRGELAAIDGQPPRSVEFRLRSTRPGHFSETLYFDHPAFGTLVRIGEPGNPEP